MSYAVAYEVPSNERLYQQVKERIGQVPDTLQLQLVMKTPGGLRHILIWESKQEWQQFRDSRIRRAVNAVLSAMGIPEPPPPAEEELAVVDLVGRA